ncbi:hypothetical protein A3Q56_01751 [Intoshia linei]|uniref:CARD domain-containing protein n=1 Tax=Intoshia linei TaxID=1819745 RepID=A0A177B879_9BILA|nr:hypothetical protein A3Q56_01751 [Intoshia linei]
MDIKSKIDRCRSIIIENIIIDNNFIKKIDQLKVLPASIIEDIKNQESKIIKVEILLEALAIQHCNKWELFCNALQISGQKFLTYVIREENDIMEENCKKIVEDSINKYTNIGKYISLQEKSKLARCLSEKIKAQLLFEIYNGCIEEKEKTMKAREIHIYDIIKYIDTIRNHEKKMCDISYEAKQLQNKSDQTELELKNKDDELNELRRNSFERLKIKHRYHKANENQLSRLTNRLGSIKNFVQNLNKKICETVASETEKHYQDATIKKG